MKVYIETANNNNVNKELEKVIAFSNNKKLYANLKDSSFSFELPDNRYIYLFGDIFYYIKRDGNIKLTDTDSKDYLKKIFSEYRLKDVISSLEGQYIGFYIDLPKQSVQIFSDRYARVDCFYVQNGRDFYLATDLDFIFQYIKPAYNQKMLAHFFCVYGWYAPKGLTIYENVRQLGVGEIITITESGIHSKTIEFKPLEIENYTDKDDLEDYYKILRESIITRVNRKGKIWVASSSGWDSSIILSILVNEFGSQNVGMLTGKMEYSEQTGDINKFEINKIKKIGEFYGIKPKIVNFDFKNKKAPDYWKKFLPYYRSKHMYANVTYNYSKLSDWFCDVAGKGQIIFSGETADSFHNFGFSQFATFFHTNKSFTEYADKMNCYLYGPSFFKKVIDGSYERDKVFQIFKKMIKGVEFASGRGDRKDIIESYLFPFFYGAPRIPFAMTYKNNVLTKNGQKAIYIFPFREYMPEVLSGLTEKNIYSWLIYLYHSFHAQGSTVNTQKHAMEFHGHKWRMPFNDYRMIEFLSKAPERWGRGLELNNTKYPLKWVAQNKINFPYKLLNEGAHSYLYDVVEGFSLGAEVTYRSGVTEFFKDMVGTRTYKDVISDEYLDVTYLDKLVAGYLNGKQVKGKDFNNLVSLITLCITGWY